MGPGRRWLPVGWDHPCCQSWDHPEGPPTPERVIRLGLQRGGPMACREVSVVQVKEALRRWLRGDGERPIAQGVGVDRKTARRYIAAAVEGGVDRWGGEEQLTDELIGLVVERVRPRRVDGHGEAWRTLLAEEERVREWVRQ